MIKSAASPQIETSRCRQFLGKVADYSARMICLASLAWFALILTQTFGNGAAGETQGRYVEVESFDVPPGYWTFHDSELSYESSECSLEELEKAFFTLESSVSPRDCEQRESVDASQMIRLAESNGATRSKCEMGEIWRLDDHELRFRIVATNDDDPTLLALAFAVRKGSQWELFTLQFREHEELTLLPMGPDASTTCSRLSTTGELVMQIVSTVEPGVQIKNRWEQHGWIAEETPWGDGGSLSLICRKDGVAIYVWENGTGDSRSILLSSSHNSRRN